MSTDSYSTYEAKARFSELLRKVRSGRSVFITYHGEPVAELRPIVPQGSALARVEQLAERGLVTPRPSARAEWAPGASRAGALQRFLEERNDG